MELSEIRLILNFKDGVIEMTDTELLTEQSGDLSIVCFGASEDGLKTYLEIL
jgi:hypothetical protein